MNTFSSTSTQQITIDYYSVSSSYFSSSSIFFILSFVFSDTLLIWVSFDCLYLINLSLPMFLSFYDIIVIVMGFLSIPFICTLILSVILFIICTFSSIILIILFLLGFSWNKTLCPDHIEVLNIESSLMICKLIVSVIFVVMPSSID